MHNQSLITFTDSVLSILYLPFKATHLPFCTHLLPVCDRSYPKTRTF